MDTKRPQISFFPNEEEYRDFEFVKQKLERNSNSDTIRAMIRLTKKILAQNTAIAVSIPADR